MKTNGWFLPFFVFFSYIFVFPASSFCFFLVATHHMNHHCQPNGVRVKLRRAINRIPEYKNTIAVEEQHTATSELHQRKAINTKRKLAKGRLVSRLKKQRSVNGKTGGKDRSKVVPVTVTAVMTEVGEIPEGAGNVQL